MFDPNAISKEERELLLEVAKAKGQTLEQVLTDLGHNLTPKPEETPVEPEIVFSGGETKEPPPLPTEAPIRVVEEAKAVFEPKIVPEVELPPPPAADEGPSVPPPADGEDEEDDAPSTINHICVQCGWDQNVPVIPEPEHQDKIGFLQAILGQQVFSKRYALFGGNLRVTFRTLTIREIDTLYQETFRAQKAGIISTSADYYEYLNRQRLFLQLTALAATQTALHIKLPDGLTPETHPDANSYWIDFLKAENAYQEPDSNNPNSPTLLMQIQDYVLGKVIRTEQLQRTITHTCNKFNRLVARLEACVDNPDFWSETGPQY